MTELAEVELSTHEGVPVAAVTGEIDLSNADATLHRLLDLADGEARRLVLDLSRLDYLDSAGVRILFRLGSAGDARGARLRAVVPAAAPIRRVLDLADVGKVLAVHETVDDAVTALRRTGGATP